MSVINLQNIRQADKLLEELHGVRNKLEELLNLEKVSANQKPVSISNNKIMLDKCVCAI